MATNLNGTEVVLIEENVKTGGHYLCEGFKISQIQANETKNFDFSFPIPISILAAFFINEDVNNGDNGDFIISPETQIGVITSPVVSGDVDIIVNQGIIDNKYAELGYNLLLDDGTNKDDLGLITAISGTTVTVELSAPNGFSANTPIKRNVFMSKNVHFQSKSRVQLGHSKIGGSYIPANTKIRLIYRNTGGTIKDFIFHVEYLY